ncbi:hypothetical protein VNO78_21515 [Psophocarpus tetragonolobus]|uniref:Uncharacterized protein n=1 Tax=Psophocarpus tetragonolobus TaxID=3891 RepID=A0AAN9SFG0_PSOTE
MKGSEAEQRTKQLDPWQKLNNAEVRGTVKRSLELCEEEWNQTQRTNLTGTWLVSKYVCKRMREAQRKGSIINIASIAALNGGYVSGSAAYASAKSGVIELTKVMALELGVNQSEFNITRAFQNFIDYNQ